MASTTYYFRFEDGEIEGIQTSTRAYSNERGPRPTFATCGNCGGYPIGIGCYHICFNSVHYYTPEQERYDDMCDDGSDDRYERYAATAESSQYADADDQAYEIETFSRPATPEERTMFVGPDTDDIPF